MEYKKIQYRLKRGYTTSIYGTREDVHEQMTRDIKTLLEELKDQLSLSDTRKNFYCYEELDEKLPRCKKQCVVCRSTQNALK